MWLTYGAVGVALGDLGTSPIYTLSSVFHGNVPTLACQHCVRVPVG